MLPSTSTGRSQQPQRDPRELIDERANQMIRDAENSKARIFSTPGRIQQSNLDGRRETREPQSNTITALVDEGYIVVSAHLD